jgi:hypothetical protein
MGIMQQLLADITAALDWEFRALRMRALRIAWGAALAVVSAMLVLTSVLLFLGAVYLQVETAMGAVAGLLATAAFAVLCALGAGLAAKTLAER